MGRRRSEINPGETPYIELDFDVDAFVETLEKEAVVFTKEEKTA